MHMLLMTTIVLHGAKLCQMSEAMDVQAPFRVDLLGWAYLEHWGSWTGSAV